MGSKIADFLMSPDARINLSKMSSDLSHTLSDSILVPCIKANSESWLPVNSRLAQHSVLHPLFVLGHEKRVDSVNDAVGTHNICLDNLGIVDHNLAILNANGQGLSGHRFD